ncbi:MAG: hypothetical protein U1F49_05980 [Rubrivivax sp.]
MSAEAGQAGAGLERRRGDLVQRDDDRAADGGLQRVPMHECHAREHGSEKHEFDRYGHAKHSRSGV